LTCLEKKNARFLFAKPRVDHFEQPREKLAQRRCWEFFLLAWDTMRITAAHYAWQRSEKPDY
jgi:hypothetical protein